jgi:hypothetical protein
MLGRQTNMNFLKRILIFGLLASGLQLLIYFLVLFLIRLLGILFSNPDIISEYGLYLSIIIFGIMLIIQNLLTTIINRNWFTWTTIILTLLIYFIGWGEDFNSWPVKTIIYLIFGTLTIFSKFYLDRHLANYMAKKARPANSG